MIVLFGKAWVSMITAQDKAAAQFLRLLSLWDFDIFLFSCDFCF